MGHDLGQFHPSSSQFTPVTSISMLHSHLLLETPSSHFATVAPTKILYGFEQTIIDIKHDWKQQRYGFYGMQQVILYGTWNRVAI
jgi:hypothetical protein